MDDIKQIELETARLKLARERMAYEDELKKRERAEQAKEAAVGVVEKTTNLWGKVPKVLRWTAYLIGGYTVLAFILVSTGIAR